MPNECEASKNFSYLRSTMKRLPIGIQDFETLINSNCYYVDKTPFIYDLVQKGKFFFLSRPRRFGKSLFVSTIKAAFEGKKHLFKGLFLENHWDWQDVYPVIFIQLSTDVIASETDAYQLVINQLQSNALELNVELQIQESPGLTLQDLVLKVYKRFQKPVVLLLDEYDKPLLDVLPDLDKAFKIRRLLRRLYAPIKSLDPYLKFVFITGVSQFTKVSLFSELNNLEDITLNPDFGNICGYTQKELETVFSERLHDVPLEALKDWYNGYYYLADTLYNPFDVLLFLRMKKFRSFWFETGTPTFLAEILKNHPIFIPELESLWYDHTSLVSVDIERLEPITLMFQTGYLTIKEVFEGYGVPRYKLSYPNREVEESLNRFLIKGWLNRDSYYTNRHIELLMRAFIEKAFDRVQEIFNQLISGIPYDWFRRNALSKYEGYWASIFYMALKGTGLPSWGEDTTNTGRIDMVVELKDAYVLLEFKIGSEGDEVQAIEQMKTKGYAQKYTDKGKEVILLGLVFDKERRGLVGCKWEVVE